MKRIYSFKNFKAALAGFILLITMMLGSTQNASASHMVGSDITYSCTTTPGIYQITYIMYRDCLGIPICNCPGVSGCTKQVSIYGADPLCNGVTLGSATLAALPNVSGFDIITTCKQVLTVCTNCLTRSAGSFTPGIEKYVFQGNVNLSGLPSNCCKVKIGFTECCRNSAITTGGANANYYVEAMVDRCQTPCNNAPTFTNDPVAIACNGQDFTYNLGAVDPDGDSLSYNMGQSLQGVGAPITYNAPYSPNVPFPFLGAPNPILPAPAGLNLDPVTGDLRFRPMGNFVSVLVIEVKQWKTINGVPTHVGTTQRDLQFYSVACPNNFPPVFCTFDDAGTPTTPACAKYDYSTCAAQKLCFFVQAKDDTTDTTDFVWNPQAMGANPVFANGATFTPAYPGTPPANRVLGPKHDRWQFCWTPPANMASNTPYYFILTARDRACPVPGRITHSFSILVRPIPNALINKAVACNKINLSFTLTGKPVPLNNSYTQWRIETEPGSGVYNAVNGQTVSNYYAPKKGNYRVVLRLTTTAPPAATTQHPFGGCPNDSIVDMVNVPTDPVDVSVRDTFTCLGTPVDVTGLGKDGGGGYRYEFYDGPLSAGPSTIFRTLNSNAVATITTSAVGPHAYKVRVTDINNCKDSDQFIVDTKPLPIKEATAKMRICFGTQDTIDAGTNNNNIATYSWSVSPVNNWLPDTTSQKIAVRDSGLFMVRKTDNFGCVNTDTVPVFRNNRVPTTVKDTTLICFKDPPITLTASGNSTEQGILPASIDSFQWQEIPVSGTYLSRTFKLDLSPAPTVTKSYEVRGFITYDGVNCSWADTATVIVNPLPVFPTFTKSGPICRTDDIISIPTLQIAGSTVVATYPYDNFTAFTAGRTGVYVDKLKNLPLPSDAQPFGNRIIYVATDNITACKNTDTFLIGVFPNQKPIPGPNRSWCDNMGIFNIRTMQNYTPKSAFPAVYENWFGNGVFVNNVNNNTYSFDPKDPGVKSSNKGDTNILTIELTRVFPSLNPVKVPTGEPPAAPISSPVGGCVADSAFVMKVFKTPTLKAGTGPSVCVGSPILNLSTHYNAKSTPAPPFKISDAFWSFKTLSMKNSLSIFNNGQMFDPTHQDVSIPDGGQQTYVLYLTDTSNGCFVRDSANLIVNGKPIVDVGLADITQAAVCSTDGPVNITLNPGPLYWNSNDITDVSSSPAVPTANLTISNPQNRAVFKIDDLAAEGLYTIKFAYTDGLSGCKNEDTTHVYVQFPPKIKVSDDGEVCAYGATFKVDLMTAPSPPYTFRWDEDGEGSIQDPTANQITYDATKNDIDKGSIRFWAITENNGECAAVSDTASFIIHKAPKAVLSCATCQSCIDDRKQVIFEPVLTAGDPEVGTSTYTMHWYVSDPLFTSPKDTTGLSMSFPFRKAGTYPVRFIVKTPVGCVDTSNIQNVVTFPSPVASFEFDPPFTTIARPYFNFTNKTDIEGGSTNVLSYLWDFGKGMPIEKDTSIHTSTEISPQNVKFPADTINQIVTLYATSDQGCRDTTMRDIRIQPDITVFIPNAFRPDVGFDADGCPYGCNRSFKVAAHGYETIEIFIFNRWGQQVWYTRDPNVGWNGSIMNDTGKPCQQDSYIYQVNATSFSGKSYQYSGSITLLR